MTAPANLTAHRAGLLLDVRSRYHKLKGKGVADEEARNIAAAQAAVSGSQKPRATASTYRRLLDADLAPKSKPGGPVRGPSKHWRLPE